MITRIENIQKSKISLSGAVIRCVNLYRQVLHRVRPAKCGIKMVFATFQRSPTFIRKHIAKLGGGDNESFGHQKSGKISVSEKRKFEESRRSSRRGNVISQSVDQMQYMVIEPDTDDILTFRVHIHGKF